MAAKKTKSEQMLGNTRAKLGKYESLVLRLPVAFVDGLANCIAKDLPEGIPEPNKRDILEYALITLRDHIEAVTGKYIPWPVIHEDGEALELLSPEIDANQNVEYAD